MILLQFAGPQDIEAFGKVCEAVNDMDMTWSGGSHEFHLEATKDGRIVFTNEEVRDTDLAVKPDSKKRGGGGNGKR